MGKVIQTKWNDFASCQTFAGIKFCLVQWPSSFSLSRSLLYTHKLMLRKWNFFARLMLFHSHEIVPSSHLVDRCIFLLSNLYTFVSSPSLSFFVVGLNGRIAKARHKVRKYRGSVKRRLWWNNPVTFASCYTRVKCSVTKRSNGGHRVTKIVRESVHVSNEEIKCEPITMGIKKLIRILGFQ